MRRYQLPFLISLCLTAVSACSDRETEGTTPNIPQVVLSVEPADLMSSVDATPITFVVGRYGPAVSQAVVDELINSVQVVGPDGTTRPLQATKLNDYFTGSDRSGDSFRAYQVSVPGLDDGWNAVRIKLPDGVIADPLSVAPTSSAGEPSPWVSTRVNPSSSPTMRAVLVCGKDDGTVKVRLLFSEFVRYAPNAEKLIDVALDDTSCAPLSLSEDGESETTDRAEFACQAGKTGKISVRLDGGLVGASGVAVTASRDGGADSVVVDSMLLTETYEGCLLDRSFTQ